MEGGEHRAIRLFQVERLRAFTSYQFDRNFFSYIMQNTKRKIIGTISRRRIIMAKKSIRLLYFFIIFALGVNASAFGETLFNKMIVRVKKCVRNF